MVRKVACIDRSNLNQKYQAERLILKIAFEDILSDFKNIIFREKVELEKNENFKQIIPYVVLQNNQNDIAIYQRRGNEQRLHGLWSAGFGGHIEDFEFKNNQDVQKLFIKSAIRELQEEFSDKEWFDLKFEGVINEELTKVGRTHIALVFSAMVNNDLFEPSREIEQIKWITIDESKNYQKELWSDMAIELIINNRNN